uniref:Uncharacterized protein n=1 Tax=Brassica oleracea var. oleracea TaxID=109376 RepID=A0A0D3CS17_BRAOL
MFLFSSGQNQITKVKLNDYNKALSGRQLTIRGSRCTVASIDTVARKSIDTVARKSIDTVAKKNCKRKRSEEDEFARGSTMVAQHRSTEHH